ncbi:MAG: hypothetical protein WD208_13475 [Dehalococcoidia bacterium]
MTKVLLIPEWGDEHYAQLKKRHPGVEFIEAHGLGDVDRHIVDSDAVFGYLTPDQFDSAKSLKWMQVLGAGMESVFTRIPQIAQSDVVVTNGRGAGAPIIGEHALAGYAICSRQSACDCERCVSPRRTSI